MIAMEIKEYRHASELIEAVQVVGAEVVGCRA